MKKIQDLRDIRGKVVLVVVDFNVHIVDGVIANDFRILRTLPTITFLRERGARILLVSHIGEDEGGTLKPITQYLESFVPVTFVSEISGGAKVVAEMRDGDVVLFDNIRKDPREELNDEVFAKELASLAHLYVNEAFSVSHRVHASIVSVPKFIPAYAGIQFQAELEHLSLALQPPHPSLFIIGGAKPETKVPLLEKFLDITDHVCIGGIPANEVFKSKDYEIGKSIVSKKRVDVSRIKDHANLVVPLDVTVQGVHGTLVKLPNALSPDESIVDIGPRTLSFVTDLVKEAELVIWNGPLGIYEDGFTEHTKELARVIANAKGKSIVGGGDTYTVIGDLRLEDAFDFVSTAGGAMIDFLCDGDLPGIKALDASS